MTELFFIFEETLKTLLNKNSNVIDIYNALNKGY